MSWRPNSDAGMARVRARMLDQARAFFNDREVLEVNTPALSARATIDPNIESISALHAGQQLFLHTSPEYFMKRLLAAGYPDIYQICRVFRGGESGRYHLPEFTLVEWYRLNYGLQEIMRETAALVMKLLTSNMPNREPVYITYAQAFQQALSLDPSRADIDALASAVDADTSLRNSMGDDHDAWLDLAMASRVATSFAADRLTLVYHYPLSQASLARACPDNEYLADRFELFLGALELANGFVELTDAGEQHRRFRMERELRESRGLPIHAIDEKLVDALRSGLPQTAGVALGLDRLLMIENGLDDINAVTTFTPGE
jgi:elongation factor P--(R)-beta-lysine ligase